MKKRQQAIRLIALVLAGLMLLGIVVSAIVSTGLAEEQDTVKGRNQYSLQVEFLEDAQALRVSQRLAYTNTTGVVLDRVEFAIYGNMFRRESALMYENDALMAAFSAGYAPGGLSFTEVTVNGEAADWGMLGENEMYMRVACALEDGESCEFGFEYILLLTRNCAFLGIGDMDWRLSGFYPQALKWEYGGFVSTKPVQHAQYVFADRADYSLEIVLPERYLLASTGACASQDNGDGTVTWEVNARGVRDLAVSLGMRWREYTGQSELGTTVRALTNSRSGGRDVLNTALETLNLYEGWFGALGGTLTIAQSSYALECLSLPGVLWVSKDVMSNSKEARMTLRRGLAKQFFGYVAYVMPTEDAWLSDSLCEYLAYLALEAADGHEVFLKEINRVFVPAVQYTVPGGLEITSSATVFSASEYEAIVKKRGALVFHELRNAMGLETMLEGLRLFYEKGLSTDLLGEYDLVDALDESSGKSWEAFLTDWLFNVDEYGTQDILILD